MVKIHRDEHGQINMKIEQDELHTLIAYMAVGNSREAELFADEHNLTIPSFINQTPLFEAMVEFEKTSPNKYQ